MRLSNGRVLSWIEADALDRQARWRKFGAMDPSLWRALESSASEVHEVVAFFKSEPGPRAIAAARLRYLAAVPAAVEVTGDFSQVPVVLVRGAAAALQQLAKLPQTARVIAAKAGERELHHSSPTNSTVEAQMDTSFNAVAAFGEGQRIGIVEDNGQALYDTHVSLSLAELDPLANRKVTYAQSPVTYGDDSDCTVASNDLCMDLGQPEKNCVSTHASSVISVLAGATGSLASATPYAAAKARYYYANGGDGSPSNICAAYDLFKNYDWLDSNDVKTVVESWSCVSHPDPASQEGVTQDWFARHSDMTIVKAAGNDTRPRAACPYTLNSTCVGGHVSGATGMSSTRRGPTTAGRLGGAPIEKSQT